MGYWKPPKRKNNSKVTGILFEFERKGDTLFVTVSGEADLVGASELRRTMEDKLPGINRIVFDLSKLEFADSYFLRLLVKLRKKLGGVSSVKV